MRFLRRAIALSLCLSGLTGGVAVADGPQLLPASLDVPVGLSSAGFAAYDLPAGQAGTLSFQLQSGDVNVSLQNDDQSTSVQDSLSGSGTASIGVSGGQTMHLSLSSQGGAQMSVRFDPGAIATGNVVTSGSTAVSNGSTAVSTSSSTVNVTHDISVTGGSAGSVSGGSIRIVNGQVTVTGGQ